MMENRLIEVAVFKLKKYRFHSLELTVLIASNIDVWKRRMAVLL
jgi:hypothetical protein